LGTNLQRAPCRFVSSVWSGSGREGEPRSRNRPKGGPQGGKRLLARSSPAPNRQYAEPQTYERQGPGLRHSHRAIHRGQWYRLKGDVNQNAAWRQPVAGDPIHRVRNANEEPRVIKRT
jgi:hypothetical protein